MTTQEMHIDLDMHLQKINSQITKNIEPEEKDWLLNEEVHKYIQSKLSDSSNNKQIGFQNTSKRIEDIKDLVREKTLYVQENNEGQKYAILPDDYFDYVKFDGLVAKDCGQTLTSKTTTTKYKTQFNLNLPTTGNITGYKINIYVGGVPNLVFDAFVPAYLPANYFANQEFFKQKFMLNKALQILLKKSIENKLNSPVELYWERDGYSFNSETFTLYSIVPIEKIAITVNGTTTTDFTTSTLSTITYPLSNYPLRGSVRVIDDEFYTDVNTSALSQPKARSLTSVLREGVIVLEIPKSVIIGVVKSTYICKPTLIDLYLNSNLNMSRKVCEEIVRNTAQFIKALITDGNYTAYVRENMITE